MRDIEHLLRVLDKWNYRVAVNKKHAACCGVRIFWLVWIVGEWNEIRSGLDQCVGWMCDCA